jgi:hypothetical protein
MVVTMPIQVTFDAHDPHALAAFWEAAMDDFEAEVHHDIVQGAIDGGFVTPDSDDVEEVDGSYRWRTMAAIRNPATGDRLLFIEVPEAKTAKNRVHLDLHVTDRQSKLEQLYALGATHLWDGQVGPQSWVTIADPEGNELCVA